MRRGYPNAEGFLAPYRGQSYHLKEWYGAGNTPTTAKEFFNIKHFAALNVIERAFGLLKANGQSFVEIRTTPSRSNVA